VETLGSASAICSDKTGTLTQNQMTAVKLYVNETQIDVTGQGYDPEGTFHKNGTAFDPSTHVDVQTLLVGGLLASDARLEENGPTADRPGFRMIGDPTEGALVVLAAKANFWRARADNRFRA
jgi:Ca2+-transporting ATPase